MIPFAFVGRSKWDPDAKAYIAQVEAADEEPLPVKIKLAINRFVRQCKRDASSVPGRSNWQALKASCLLAGAKTLTGALVPLQGPAPTNINFVSGDYSATGGLKGNGSKWLDSGYRYQDDPNLHVSDMHSAVYSTETGNQWLIGQNTNWCMNSTPGTPNRIGFRAGLPTDFYQIDLEAIPKPLS